MREIRKSGSEGGAGQTNVPFLPLSLLKSKSMLFLVLDVKTEFDNVAVLDRVFLAFESELAGFAGFGFGATGHEVVERDDLRRDEPTFEVTVNDTGGRWGFVASLDRPGAGLLRTGREIGAEAE